MTSVSQPAKKRCTRPNASVAIIYTGVECCPSESNAIRLFRIDDVKLEKECESLTRIIKESTSCAPEAREKYDFNENGFFFLADGPCALKEDFPLLHSMMMDFLGWGDDGMPDMGFKRCDSLRDLVTQGGATYCFEMSEM